MPVLNQKQKAQIDNQEFLEFMRLNNVMVREVELKKIYGFNTTDIQSLLLTTDFPKPVQFPNIKTHFWRLKDVDNWMYEYLRKAGVIRI